MQYVYSLCCASVAALANANFCPLIGTPDTEVAGLLPFLDVCARAVHSIYVGTLPVWIHCLYLFRCASVAVVASANFPPLVGHQDTEVEGLAAVASASFPPLVGHQDTEVEGLLSFLFVCTC
jgi:hypothetical protein